MRFCEVMQQCGRRFLCVIASVLLHASQNPFLGDLLRTNKSIKAQEL